MRESIAESPRVMSARSGETSVEAIFADAAGRLISLEMLTLESRRCRACRAGWRASIDGFRKRT